MAAYHVELQPSAEKDLERLAQSLVTRILARAYLLAGDPRPNGCLKLEGADLYRVRVGEYRIIYKIDDRARLVALHRVRHRSEVYRRLR